MCIDLYLSMCIDLYLHRYICRHAQDVIIMHMHADRTGSGLIEHTFLSAGFSLILISTVWVKTHHFPIPHANGISTVKAEHLNKYLQGGFVCFGTLVLLQKESADHTESHTAPPLCSQRKAAETEVWTSAGSPAGLAPSGSHKPTCLDLPPYLTPKSFTESSCPSRN